MELTFAQWQALEAQAREAYPYIAALVALVFAGTVLYFFINDKEGV